MTNKFRIEKGSFEMKARPINYTVNELEAWVNQQVDQDFSIVSGAFETLEEAKACFESEKENCRTRRVATNYGFSVIEFDKLQLIEFECDDDGEDTYDLYEIHDSFIADDESLSNFEEDDEEDDD